MNESFIRTAMLLGIEAEALFSEKSVVICGLGGVGGHCAEALARCGIGQLHLIDHDVVQPSNLNRQIVAAKSTINMPKVEVMKRRIEDISDCEVSIYRTFISKDNVSEILPITADYIVDAIDTVTAKASIVHEAMCRNVPVVSCMGTGNRLDPTMIRVGDIFDTEGCPLARAMRKEMRRKGIKSLKVVYSMEKPLVPILPDGGRSRAPGSISFVPAAAGLTLASVVAMDIYNSWRH